MKSLSHPPRAPRWERRAVPRKEGEVSIAVLRDSSLTQRDAARRPSPEGRCQAGAPRRQGPWTMNRIAPRAIPSRYRRGRYARQTDICGASRLTSSRHTAGVGQALKVQAVVLGAAGFGGGELLRLLVGHPNVASLLAVSQSHAGQLIWNVHPNLRGFVEDVFFSEVAWSKLSKEGAIVVFSAQPHFALAQQLTDLESEWERAGIADRISLIDLSGDFRLRDATAFEAAYGKPHPCASRLGSFVYGLPEWKATELRGATRIANPGCFATAVQLALLPLHDLELGFVAVSGVTGSSGSGALPSETAHHPTRAHDFRAYKSLEHQHQAEMEGLLQDLGMTAQLSFVPHSAPLVRGIFATVQFCLPEVLSEKGLRQRFQATYDRAPFVRNVAGSPRLASVVGTNFCELGIAVKGRSAVIFSALDNLVKGMAGQAIQNMNLALGLSEKAGLWAPGLFPA